MQTHGSQESVAQLEVRLSQRRRLLHFGLIFAGAALLLWPALLNGYPLLYPDSVSYIGDGSAAWHALLHPGSMPLGWMRSAFYSLGILPLHAGGNPWLIIVVQAVLTAWVLCLVVRSFFPQRAGTRYAFVMSLLAACTSMAWFTSYLMPDVFGALLYLAMYLLVFARASLSALERRGLMVLAWWSCLTHVTHLIVAAGLCLVMLCCAGRREGRRRTRWILQVCLILIVAVASQLTLNLWLYRKASLFPEQPPLLTARLVADGPARQYLQTHCGAERWSLCSRLPMLTGDEDDFLWSGTGVLATATPAEQQQVRREEMPLLLATVRTYPRQQLVASARNAWHQLLYFDLDNFDQSSWMQSALPSVLPGSATRYAQTLQVRSALPTDFFSRMSRWTTGLAVIVVLLALRRPSRLLPGPLLGLFLVVVPALLLNATVTGVLSGLDARYQARVIWLLPLLAMLIVLRCTERLRERAGAQRASQAKA